MKLYLLDYYNKNNELPGIDKTFVNTCIKVQCEENKGGRHSNSSNLNANNFSKAKIGRPASKRFKN
jgi:hypothetical protein